MKKSPWLALASAATLLFLYLPIFILVVFSFNASRYTAHWTGFTWHWYATLLRNEDILRATLNSLVIASVSSLAATALATAAAVALGRFHWEQKELWESLLFLPLVIPELMMGIGFLLFFGLLGLERLDSSPVPGANLVKLALAHTTLNIPIVWLIVRARLKKLDPRLEEAAMDLGASRWMAFWRVTLPLLMPGILGGALMAFAISLDDFVISFFSAGPNSTTLPIQIYSMLKFSISPEVNALSTVLFAASMSLVLGAWLLQDRKDAHA